MGRGPHSNGYSLIRKVLEISGSADIDGRPAAEVLLEPTRIYVKPILALAELVRIKGLAHITGGGLTENIPRVLPAGLHARIDTSSWDLPPVFDFLQREGHIETDELRRTLNCGIGMIVIVDEAAADAAIAALTEAGETAWLAGRIVDGDEAVDFAG